MLLLALPLLAASGGVTGRSTTGCGSCHGASASSSVAASFTASASTVAPGGTVDIDFTVSESSMAEGGLDVAASGGSLAAGSNNQLRSGEITHASPQAFSGGQVSFDFTWTAPSSEGSYTLTGAGNAVNGDNRSSSADRWALASNLVLTVSDGCDDTDGDGFGDTCGEDCDEGEPEAWTGRVEVCDDIDNDCDGSVDEGASDASTWYADADGDGFGDPAITTRACDAPEGFVADASDCDDGWARINPGAAETCDGVDEDCDGRTDEDAVDTAILYVDADGDGFGDPDRTEAACGAGAGLVEDASDCDDTDAAVSPAGVEVCDVLDVDEDCDGTANDADADVTGTTTWYVDADGDGWGGADTLEACEPPSGAVAYPGDCDDAEAAVNPGAAEACDATADQNCDGSFGSVDGDGDGYSACTDCNDADPTVSPAGTETCNLADDDCDGTVDEDAVDAALWFVDADLDGHGDPDATVAACQQPDGTSTLGDDCDDADATAAPGNAEVWYDGVDQACDGGSDNDQDGDGHDAMTEGGIDCDDTDPATFPGAPDEPYDGIANDCHPNDEWDQDLDGYEHPYDCDDRNVAINPGAEEVWYDGVDQNCDGNDTDQDGDGTAVEGDCDDTDPTVAAECDDDTGGGDTGDTGAVVDTAGEDSGVDSGGASSDKEADCGCAVGGPALGWGLALAGLLTLTRRRK